MRSLKSKDGWGRGGQGRQRLQCWDWFTSGLALSEEYWTSTEELLGGGGLDLVQV